jgi:hypothetical protein
MIINTVTKQYTLAKNTFVSYQIEYQNGTKVSVPLDEANTDYQAIQEWIAEGNSVIDNPPQENN